MFAAGVTEFVIILSTLILALISLGFYNYLSSSCVLYITGESFSISNCPVNSDLANLVREQRELLSCGLK
uniref:Movement protein TGBp3 n=1 Tax=Cowpea mild mottle virus TaxID=67761 RepID=A0A8G1LUE8_9VIRU|nr:triple gene block protein 3 [Cowpea mild mottle virus]UZP17170.1 triple gene block 3 [Cowpea mild mottle virus]